MKRNTLIFSPYAYWVCHILFERLVSKRLMELGHEVNIIYCDGVLENCDMRKNCLICRVSRMRVDAELEIPALPMSKFITNRNESNLINQLSDDELAHFHYKGINLAEAVMSTYCSYFRKDEISFLTEQEREVYRQLLRSSILVYQTLENAYQQFQPNFGILFNGRFFATRVALEFFKQKKIDFVSHEIGVLLDSFQFNFDRNSFYFRHVIDHWEKRKHLPVSKLDFLKTIKMFREWRLGRNRASLIFMRPGKKDPFIASLEKRSKQYKKTMLLLTSSTDEFVAIDDYQQYFSSQVEWLETTIDYMRNHSEYFAIIRVHPNTINRDGKLISMMDFMEKFEGRLPDNVVIIGPKQKANTYELMKMSDVGITYGSTASIEMLSMKKRVLLARQCIYQFVPSFDKIFSKEEYIPALEKSLSHPLSNEELKQFFRFMTYYVKERSLHFPYIRFIDHKTSFMNFTDYDSIPDKSHLNKIVDSILHGPELLFGKVPQTEHPDEIEIINQLIVKRRRISQVMILSAGTFEQFEKGTDQAFATYERLVLRHNATPDILFVNDKIWLTKEFERLAGYMGFYSKPFKAYYRTLFRSPWLVFLNRAFRKISRRIFKKFYTADKIVETLLEDFQPDYIVSYVDEETLQSRFNLKKFRHIIYMK